MSAIQQLIDLAYHVELDTRHKAAEELAMLRRMHAKYLWLINDCDGFEISMRETDEDGNETWYSGTPATELDAAINAAIAGEPK